MLFSFLTRFFSSKEPKQHEHIDADESNATLKTFVLKEGGKFFPDFKLYHQDSITSIDALIFLPNFGIFLGETIHWRADELENATVERSSVQIKRPAATRFKQVESKIRRKLEDVLSFDSTPIHRFIWMKNLAESEFDALDPSFHELLPKTRLFFNDESVETVKAKLYALGEYRHEPYSTLKIIGALNSHTYVLPTPLYPAGALLSPQQTLFLTSQYEGTTLLVGGYGSGKSTLLIRKALLNLLLRPHDKVLIITPTLLGSELLRDELISLLEYGALSINFGSLHFYNPPPSKNGEIDRLEDLKIFQEASVVLCDDLHLFEESFIDKLQKHRENRSLLFTSIHSSGNHDTVFELLGQFQRIPTPKKISSPSHDKFIVLLLLHLRKILAHAQPTDVLITVCGEDEMIPAKEAIDEYFNLNCRVLIPSFSLQYQNLDSVIVTTIECLAPLSRAHVILVGIDPANANYSLALSRASETLTIISTENLP